MTDPASFAFFAWQAGWVVALRSARLWAEPGGAALALAEMAQEKQLAFARGALAATAAAARGARPERVMRAALTPARRQVSANLRRLTRPG